MRLASSVIGWIIVTFVSVIIQEGIIFITQEAMRGNVEDFDEYVHPLLPHAGKIVSHPIGEQLLAFCEADIAEPLDAILSKLLSDTPDAQVFGGKPGKAKKPPEVLKPRTDVEAKKLFYENYEQLMEFAGPLLNSCLYTSIFPPLPIRCSHKMLMGYFQYIDELRGEYSKLVEFCFDADFYPDDLRGLTAPSRYRLFRGRSEKIEDPVELHVTVQFSRYSHGSVLNEDSLKKLQKSPPIPFAGRSWKKNKIEEELDMWPDSTEIIRASQAPMVIAFICRSLEEILYLEFVKMLELDMKMRKCKNCGRYFTSKGNYLSECCDRVPEGKTLSCQAIAANTKYSQKVKENPALGIFNKAYKRYHARMKVGTVKPSAFKKWKYEAVTMRDKCMNGEMTTDEFEAWIDGYFG